MLVSAIMPALNEEEHIQQSLRSIRQNYSTEELEIIIADGGSTDRTKELIPPGITFLQTPPGRATQMNRGAAAASGAIFVFIHADTIMLAGWREEVIQTLADPSISGGTFQSTLQPEQGFLMHWINQRDYPPIWQLMYGDQVQFMRRETFEKIGGFPDIPLMEDVEMSRALHKAGKITRIQQRTFTSGRRFIENGPLRQYWHNLTFMIRYLYLGASPEKIQSLYQSSRERSL